VTEEMVTFDIDLKRGSIRV